MKKLFIHIPKTGGTSVSTFLKDSGLDKWKRDSSYVNHDPLFKMEEYNIIPKDTFIFTITRNPYTRAFSYYKHFLRYQNLDITFIEFLSIIRERDRSYSSTPLILYPQSYYLYNTQGENGISKMYKLENIKEFEQDFSTVLPSLNVGSYSKEEYLTAYTKQAISLVKHLYLEDFVNLNYTFDFTF